MLYIGRWFKIILSDLSFSVEKMREWTEQKIQKLYRVKTMNCRTLQSTIYGVE